MRLPNRILLSSLLALSVCAQAQTDCSKAGIIEVRGTSKTELMPDVALLSYTAVSQNKDASSAKKLTEQKVSAFVRAIKNLGLSDSAVTASSLNLYPVYSYSKDNKKNFEGYSSSRDVKISVTDFALIDRITSLAVENSITRVNGFSYSVKDLSKVKEVTDRLAIEDAKKKASVLADGFKLSLSKPCRIRFEGSYNELMPLRATVLKRTDAASEEPAFYQPEKITVTSEVFVEYSIDD